MRRIIFHNSVSEQPVYKFVLQQKIAEGHGADGNHCERRIAFYQRGGAMDTGVRTCVWGCEFQVLCLPCAESLPGGDLAATLDGIYRIMFPPDFYKTQVVFRRPAAPSAN